MLKLKHPPKRATVCMHSRGCTIKYGVRLGKVTGEREKERIEVVTWSAEERTKCRRRIEYESRGPASSLGECQGHACCGKDLPWD
jgi:hypothetical protein